MNHWNSCDSSAAALHLGGHNLGMGLAAALGVGASLSISLTKDITLHDTGAVDTHNPILPSLPFFVHWRDRNSREQ